MRYFRVYIGYGKNDYVVVDEDEIETALYCFLTDNKGVFKNAPIRGKDIITFKPHYHAHTHWNADYEPTHADDFAQIARDCPTYDGIIEYYTDRVKYLMQRNQTSLLGTHAELPIKEPKALPARNNGMQKI